MSKKYLAIFIVVLAILIDQVSKIYVKTHFQLHEELVVFSDWFKISFVENNGMAWGVELGGKSGKLFLTLFRVVAVFGIIYWLAQKIKDRTHNGVIIAISLILAGALGNIIDSVFYGVIFNTPRYEVATLFSDDPYGTLFFGKVVDMLYFPIWEGYLPEWLPVMGGQPFTFFNAIFNGADSFISVGIVLLFLFNKHAFPKEKA